MIAGMQQYVSANFTYEPMCRLHLLPYVALMLYLLREVRRTHIAAFPPTFFTYGT